MNADKHPPNNVAFFFSMKSPFTGSWVCLVGIEFWVSLPYLEGLVNTINKRLNMLGSVSVPCSEMNFVDVRKIGGRSYGCTLFWAQKPA